MLCQLIPYPRRLIKLNVGTNNISPVGMEMLFKGMKTKIYVLGNVMWRSGYAPPYACVLRTYRTDMLHAHMCYVISYT